MSFINKEKLKWSIIILRLEKGVLTIAYVSNLYTARFLYNTPKNFVYIFMSRSNRPNAIF